jgi:cholinesterase
MQQVPAASIIAIVDGYNASLNDGKALRFNPQADNETSFANYSARGVLGRVARVPGLFGCNNDEFTALAPLPSDPYTMGVDTTQVEMGNLVTMICPLTEEVYTRQLGTNFSAPLYHYRYFGQFPNLNPFPWLGSYHAAELPLVFGTYNMSEPADSKLREHPPSTEDERAVSEYMQGAWVAFAKNPAKGLAGYGSEGGWPLWRPGNGTDGLVELGVGNKSGAVFAKSDSYVGPCKALGFNVGP